MNRYTTNKTGRLQQSCGKFMGILWDHDGIRMDRTGFGGTCIYDHICIDLLLVGDLTGSFPEVAIGWLIFIGEIIPKWLCFRLVNEYQEYPLVNKHSYWKFPLTVDLPIKTCWFSIVMLVYQRVYNISYYIQIFGGRKPHGAGILSGANRADVLKDGWIPAADCLA